MAQDVTPDDWMQLLLAEHQLQLWDLNIIFTDRPAIYWVIRIMINDNDNNNLGLIQARGIG